MKRVYFNCKFKTDIVLNSKTSTEGKNSPLDYVPGNVFLGIVAKDYENYDNSFDVFHSGKVRFNDATPLIDGKESFKVPFSYFSPKGVDDEIYVHHKIDDNLFKKLRENGIQLKQKRAGYIDKDGNFFNIKSGYSQKSAYDKKTRHSKDSAMFGYNAIKRGTEFLFSIDFDESIDDKLQNKIIQDLEGKQFIGKSKTAQYGKVKIEKYDYKSDDTYKESDGNELVVYAKSNLAFIDENGMPTAQPKFDNATIAWEKSQIRTRRYTPYNNARKTFDYERMIIEKGSVFVVKLDEGSDKNEFKKVLENGVGIYKNEGFGQVLLNPSFLMELNPQFSPKKIENSKEIDGFDGNEDAKLFKWIENKEKEKKKSIKLVKFTMNFINDNPSFERIKTSQWGQVLSIASRVNSKQELKDKLFKDGEGYLVHGKAKEQWIRKIQSLKDGIEEAKEPIKFVRLLAKEISRKIKIKDNKKEEGE